MARSPMSPASLPKSGRAYSIISGDLDQRSSSQTLHQRRKEQAPDKIHLGPDRGQPSTVFCPAGSVPVEVVSRVCSVLRNHSQTRDLSIRLCLDVHSINFSTAEISDLQFQDYLDITGSKNPALSLKEPSIPINLY
ncbi:hypothetical protein BGX30_014287 [Mortierella sp. GBA39]|nr:hypothetical protein BGX30_014287 [Mortierella sp. GBA39]